MVYIYGLVCPLEEVVRYIGKSVNPEKRLIAHVGGALRREYNHHTARWIRKLSEKGHAPSLVILQIVLAGQDWRVVEREWIAKAREAGWPITNTTAGGEGLDYIDPTDEVKYRANLGAAMRTYRQTPEWKDALQKLQQSSQSPQAREKRKVAVKNAWADPEKGARMRALLEVGRTDPDVLRKKGEATARRWAEDPQGMAAAITTPQAKSKQSEAKIVAWANPDIRKRLTAHWTPERRAKQAAALAERQAKIQTARTPEVRAKQAATLKATWARRKAEKLAARVAAEQEQ